MKRCMLILVMVALAGYFAAAQNAAVASGDAPQQEQSRDLTHVKETTANPSPAPAIPHSYALVVGVSHYAHLPAKAQLQFPDRDAEDMYTTLISAEGGNFPPENVHKLINEQATLQNLRHELTEWLPSVTGPDDRVLIYFAGHGFIAGGKGYLATTDVDPMHLADTAYPMEDLGRDIGTKIHGKWKVLITDACHSGSITPEDDTAQVNHNLLNLDVSTFSLTASRDREQSFESPQWGGGHGIFTYYVIRGLEGEADASGDGIVTADELAEYVRSNVRLATKTLQNPTSDRGSFDPNMVLAYNPGRSVKCTANCPGAPRYGTLVVQTNMDGVEVWLDGKSVGVIDKNKPLRLPGMAPGPHTVKGVHLGYEPDGPREEQVYPGQDTSVSIRILIARQKNHAAEEPFDKGVELYTRGFAVNYKQAAVDFEQALQLDPQYSQAALYLGRTWQALYDPEKAETYLKQAIAIDPDYLEARLSYAAALLDTGDYDEAIRQTNAVIQRDASNGMAWYLQSQAFVRKGSYDQAVASGKQAVKITPSNGEAHLWLAEALRLSNQCTEANPEYSRYLALSQFNSALGGQLNYYLLGSFFGFGVKKRAAEQDIWRELRAQANVGICDCLWMQKQFSAAAESCQKALSYVHDDPYANYRLGLVYAEEYNGNGNPELLREARLHFSTVIALIPDTDEAQRSRKYVANIDAVLLH
ncbi:tetratricopeptide repeat protein [Paracidobacterium acidisoli]|uniref:Peptidase C14 caspase domain-containing protein n=1 Tax=Paracidobacterium acidisoli TaxID=2303751 RepID=A0A372IQC0_9BACT|nr:tetratricopeptide repeat protein [Paracidobacterium acidisoli]MBT9331046.1 tetratricopeptide repeat protein [Paracidobacterium acidisoli]